jgi:hypothetical protein
MIIRPYPVFDMGVNSDTMAFSATTRLPPMSTRTRFYACIAALSAALLCSGPTRAADGGPPQEPPKDSLLLIPLVYYTPETSVAGGLGMVYFMYPNASPGTAPGVRPTTSSILADAIYTANGQYQLEIKPDVYWSGGRFQLSGRFSAAYYPDKFFGTGPASAAAAEEPFTPFVVALDLTLYKKIAPHLQAGVAGEFESDAMRTVAPGGALEPGTITGSRGGTSLGFGLALNWDSRDDVFAPLAGDYAALTLTAFAPAWGSDFAFTRLSLDVRHFTNLWGGHVLAAQALVTLIAGDPPFQKMARLGGLAFMRGYYTGRFRDRDLVGLQAEYRLPLIDRFGAAVFAGCAMVAPNLGGLSLANLVTTWGGGLRYRIDRDERLQLRADLGVAPGNVAFYLTVGEAF